MDLPTSISILAVVAAIGFPLLARRDLLTKLEARDQTREEWRQDLTRKLEALTEASLKHRIEFLERQHSEYKEWKHEKADPYMNDYQALERRVRRIERYLNGKLGA